LVLIVSLRKLLSFENKTYCIQALLISHWLDSNCEAMVQQQLIHIFQISIVHNFVKNFVLKPISIKYLIQLRGALFDSTAFAGL
jgi:hypothetical protein